MEETILDLDRVKEIIDAIIKVANGDYNVKVKLSGKNDYIDSIAIGLNMMVDDIYIRTLENEKIMKELEKTKNELQKKVEELEKFTKLAVGRELKMIELKKKIKDLEEKLKASKK